MSSEPSKAAVISEIDALFLNHTEIVDWCSAIDQQTQFEPEPCVEKRIPSTPSSSPFLVTHPFYVYVFNIAYWAKRHDIYYFFGGYEQIVQFHTYANPRNASLFGGDCILQLRTIGALMEALEKDGIELFGRPVFVKYIDPITLSHCKIPEPRKIKLRDVAENQNANNNKHINAPSPNWKVPGHFYYNHSNNQIPTEFFHKGGAARRPTAFQRNNGGAGRHSQSNQSNNDDVGSKSPVLLCRDGNRKPLPNFNGGNSAANPPCAKPKQRSSEFSREQRTVLDLKKQYQPHNNRSNQQPPTPSPIVPTVKLSNEEPPLRSMPTTKKSTADIFGGAKANNKSAEMMRRVEEKLLNEQKQQEGNKSGGIGNGDNGNSSVLNNDGNKNSDSSKPNAATTTTEELPKKVQ